MRLFKEIPGEQLQSKWHQNLPTSFTNSVAEIHSIAGREGSQW